MFVGVGIRELSKHAHGLVERLTGRRFEDLEEWTTHEIYMDLGISECGEGIIYPLSFGLDLREQWGNDTRKKFLFNTYHAFFNFKRSMGVKEK